MSDRTSFFKAMAHAAAAVVIGAALFVGCGGDDSDESVMEDVTTSSTEAAQPTSTGEPDQEPSTTTSSTEDESTESETAMLADPDGWTWVRHEATEVGLPEDGQTIDVTALIAGDRLFVMSGYRQRSGDADGFVESPVIWTSSDATSWSAIDMSSAEQGEGLYAAAYGSAGFVAVGEVGGDAIGAPPVGAGIAWTSADGAEWIRHTPDEWDAFVPRALTATDDGAYVAVGATDRFRASVWRSIDGTTWDEVAAFEDSEFIALHDVVAGPDGFLAVGSRGPGENAQALVVHSDDGLAWVDTAADLPPLGSPVHATVSSEGDFVVIGSDRESVGLVWLLTSPDGVTWERQPFEATGSFAYIGDVFTLPDGGVTLVSGALADADEPSVVSGSMWRVVTVDGSSTLELLPTSGVSLGTGVWSVTGDDARVVVCGRDGQTRDLVVWTATST